MTLSKTVWATAVAATLALTTLSAHADKKELVQKVLTLQQSVFDDVSRSIAEQPARQLVAGVRPIMVQAVPEDKRDATAKQIDAEIKKYIEAATPIFRASATKLAPSVVGPVLEEKFSEDELKQLATLLESPAFKKYQSVMPEATQGLMEKVVNDARPQITTKLQQLDANVRKILDTATGGKLSGGASAPAPAPTPAAKPAAKK